PDPPGVPQARGLPIRHAPQLDAADGSLDLDHAPIGAERFVQPAIARRMLAFVDSIPRLAVVLVRPHAFPELWIIGRDHAALAARGHDLVLAKRPGAHMADGTHRAPLVARAMGLGAI